MLDEYLHGRPLPIALAYVRRYLATRFLPAHLVLVVVLVLDSLGVGLVTSCMWSPPRLLPGLFHTLGITHAFEDDDENENEDDLAPQRAATTARDTVCRAFRSKQLHVATRWARLGGRNGAVRCVWEEVRALANRFKTFGSLAPPKPRPFAPHAATRRWRSSAGNLGSGFLVRSTFCWLRLRCRIGGRRCRLSPGPRALLPDLRKGPRH